MALRTLLVDADTGYRETLAAVLAHAGFAVAASLATVDGALAWLDGGRADLALVALELPGCPRLARALAARRPATVVILLAAAEDVRALVPALCAGADRYLIKTPTVS